MISPEGVGMPPIIFKASLWIHAHHETGEPIEVELFSISGEQIPLDLIRWLDKNHLDKDLFSCFHQLRTERCYTVLCKATVYSDNEYGYYASGFDVDVLSWVENRSDEDDALLIPLSEADLLGWLQF